MNLSKNQNEGDRSDAVPSLVVGVGASAGGIEALRAMLGAVSAESGVAFVIVLHLDPTRASHVSEVLQSSAPHVTVAQAAGTVRLEANRAYVIAPNSKLQLADGVLQVAALGENEPRGALVDHLFASLAEAGGSRAVGVVLSGAGQDGAEGLARIRAGGGVTIAQDPATAATSSMPESAIDAGVVDAVLAPGEIPAALVAFAERGQRPEPEPRDSDAERDPERADDARDGRGFDRILSELRAVASVDFGDYKRGTLRRRARRRMSLKGIEGWEEYASYLADHPEELDALYDDVLIGVTQFFRDPDVWDELAGELPALLEQWGGGGVRAWVPGCATGEEAYSLAMLLCEAVPAGNRNKVQIFATDVNESALAVARRGLYPPEALEHVSSERRARCLVRANGMTKIAPSIRDCVTFARHDALSDPPFSRMDIVSCRNLLIYLAPAAHARLLERLRFALREGGILVLGRAESLGGQTRLFKESSKSSLLRAKPRARSERLKLEPRAQAAVRDRPAPPSRTSAGLPSRSREAGEERRIERFVLRELTPACLVVDADRQIRHFYGPTGRYLVPPTGESRQDVLAWIRPGAYVSLRSVLKQAMESGEAAAVEGVLDRDGERERFQCTVEPIPSSGTAEALWLVAFRDLGRTALTKVGEGGEHEPLVRELEQELSETRRELQRTIERFESAGEEHDASDEELQALNEELQSSNEELEASKEELEALNEEMNTINRELEEKNADLRQTNADLSNLFQSTGIPTVFLDRDLRVRRFTPNTDAVLRLVPSDVGRSIDDIKELFTPGQTLDACRRVLETTEPDETEVSTHDGKLYRRTVQPYRIEGSVEGVCITFTDVTELRRAARASEEARAHAAAIVDTARAPVLVLDASLRIESFNAAFWEMTGAHVPIVGRPLPDVLGAKWSTSELDGLVERLTTGGESSVDGYEVRSSSGTILVSARALQHEVGSGVVLSFQDVTHERARQEAAEEHGAGLEEEARRREDWIAMLGHELRNPLAAIAFSAEVLGAGLEPERQAKVVSRMRDQIAHVGALLDGLLDNARISTGKMEIEREPVDLAAVGESVLDTVSRSVEEKGQELTVALPPAGSVWVRGDARRLTEVIGNLLSNAVKFTEPRGGVTLEIVDAGDIATIRVHDTGMGIPAELLGRVFDRFTQGPAAQGTAQAGLGLGLSIVREIVRLHGGEVEARSPGEGQGSEFIVTLPQIEHAGGAEAAARGDRATVRGPRRRVLVVDDVQDTAEALGMLLEAAGHAIRTAFDGPAALGAARDFRPEVALIDLGMPGMDGYQLGRRLREAFPGAVLVALTGYERNSARLEAAGFDHHLRKPVDMAKLSEALAWQRPGAEPGEA